MSDSNIQKESTLHLVLRLQANPADLDGWAALGQLYLYRGEYDNALLAYQRLALQVGGASAATQAAQATVLYYQAGQQLTPEALRLLYEKFGARLLEANVRSFLSVKGKGVNAGIQNTLRSMGESSTRGRSRWGVIAASSFSRSATGALMRR